MGSLRKLELAPNPANEVEPDSFPSLQARLLAGAAERIHADVEEAKRRGLIDGTGRRVSSELPKDMQPGAKQDFGG